MDPTLHAGQRLLANRLAYSPLVARAFASVDPQAEYDHPASPHRGDIVVLRRPGQPESNDLVKRIIGLPGETLEVRQGTVYVNGQPIDEPYVQRPDRTTLAPIRIPAGHVFVMGDNRPNSLDSRAFGPVSIDSLRGKVWLRYWPLPEFGLIGAP